MLSFLSKEREALGSATPRVHHAARRGGGGWPLAARAQQPAMPVIGYLNASAPEGSRIDLRAFRQGLQREWLCRGRERCDRISLGRLISPIDCRRWRPTWFAGGSTSLPRPARPLRWPRPRRPRRSPSCSWFPKTRSSLALSLASPGRAATLTGVNFFAAELAAKRLELLRDLVPATKRVAVLVIPAEPTIAEANRRDVEAAPAPWACKSGSSTPAPSPNRCRLCDPCERAAGRALHQQRSLFQQPARPIGSPGDAPRGPGDHVRGVPIAEVGGLMSYGRESAEAFRQAGIYVGRILKGEKPADLPVVQSTKFELVINASDRPDARPHRAALAARDRRRGDRVKGASSSRCSAARRPHGPSRHARSSRRCR